MINQVAFTGKNTLINSFKEFSTEKAHEYLNGGAVMPKVKKEVSSVSYASPFQSIGDAAKVVRETIATEADAANYALSHGTPKSALSAEALKHVNYLA